MDFVIAGVQKAMTSFLKLYLNETRDVYMPKGETKVFQHDVYSKEMICEVENELAKHNTKLTGIKRPDYFAENGCAKRILDHNKDMKIIVILRNPINRLISAVYHYMRHAMIDIQNIDELITRIINNDELSYNERRIRDYSFYADSIREYLRFYNPENIIFLIQEKETPQSLVDKCLNFLGIEETVTVDKNRYVNAGIYNKKILKLRHKVLRLTYDFAENDRYTEPKRNFVFKTIYRLYLFGEKIALKVMDNSKDHISDELKQGLYSMYQEDMVMTAELVGFNVEVWIQSK